MNIKWLFILLTVLFAGLISCKNNDNVFPTVTYTDLTVVNASADTLNFYLNGTRQNNSSSLYPGGYLAHDLPPAGSQNYQFKKAGAIPVLYSVPLNLAAKTYYSLYLTGAGSGAFSHMDTLYTFTDTAAAQIKTLIRFVHAAPDAGSLDVFVGDTANFKSRLFKTTSTFLATGSGQKEVKIYQSGAAAPKVDTVITFQPGRDYTLFSKGLINGKGNSAFNVGIVVNQ